MSPSRLNSVKGQYSLCLCRLGKRIRLDRKKDVSVLACKLLRTIYFTHEDFGDQADDECLKLLNKNQTVQMSHVLNWKELHIKERDYSLFCAKKETDVKNSTLWSTGFGMA